MYLSPFGTVVLSRYDDIAVTLLLATTRRLLVADDYVRSGNFSGRSLASLVDEFAAVRTATLALFRSLHDSAWLRRGLANKNEISVRALAFITAGHELHHAKILEERYFGNVGARAETA